MQTVGINVTGQNLPNVNTQGYTRQQVVLKETFSFNGKQYGTGVTIESVQSFRDRFIETRLQTENGIAGGLSAKRDTFSCRRKCFARRSFRRFAKCS